DVGRLDEIVEKDAVRRRPLLGCNLAGETMDRARADCARIVERSGEQHLPLLLPSWHGRKSAFAFATGRPVESTNGDLVSLVGRFDSIGRHVVGKLQLDGLETSRCRSVDSFEQRPFREKIAEVGGKTRHWWPSMVFNDLLRAEA